jgi:cobaltochelatase CobN
MTRGSVKIALISTKTSLRTLFEAVEAVKREAGVDVNLDVVYVHDLDKLDPRDVASRVAGADALLVDIRGGVPRHVEEAILGSRARVVVPLVGGTVALAYLRLGSLSGEVIAKRMRPLDFDADKLDVSRVFKMLNIAERVTSALPVGALRDWRNFIWLTRYWTYWGRGNLENMLKLILSEYFGVETHYDGPRREYEHCVLLPDGVCAEGAVAPKRPAVAIFLYGGMHFEQGLPVAKALREELGRMGIDAVLVVGGAAEGILKQLDTLQRYTVAGGKPLVDAVVNLQWKVINGGPYGGDVEATRRLFLEAGYLLFNGLIAYLRRYSDWRGDPRGLSPIEVVAGVALPEIDGAIEPIISATLDDTEYTDIVVLGERVRKKAARIARWIRLRYKPRTERRVAVIIYNYPPGEENVGKAAYLDVFASLEALLGALARAGYRVEQRSKDELVALVRGHLVNSPRWHLHGVETPRLPLGEYLKYYSMLPEELRGAVERFWGPPPGEINIDESRNFVIPGVILGNVFIGVQPARGFHEDPSKLYHSKDVPPHHQYIAFYYWVREVFGADAIVHLGTHGTLELLPGKEVALSETCWPDVLIGDVPHVYVYHVTNPSEMTIAKRRGYAYVITHGTPPFTNAELYGEYAELEELVREYEEERDAEKRNALVALIREKCEKMYLRCDSVEELHVYLYEMKKSAIPKGLNVLGKVWSDEEIVDYLLFVLKRDGDVKSLVRTLVEDWGYDYDALLSNPGGLFSGARGSEILERAEKAAREMIELIVRGEDPERVARRFVKRKELREDAIEALEYVRDLHRRVKRGDELGAIIRALDGLYVEPRVAGEPVRTPEVFPTGSHGYAFDPRLIPSRSAYLKGVKIAEELVRRHRERYGRYPESVGFVLWGFETAQTRGETIGAILQLLGVRLMRDKGPWAPRLEVIPLEQLGRPRVDVMVTICGFFRDMFPNLINLISQAVKLVAGLDEPPEMNYVRKHYLALRERFGEEIAAARIFGPKPGTYGTRLPELVESSNWSAEEELAKAYLEDMGYAYTDSLHATEAVGALVEALKTVDLVAQVRSTTEYDVGDLDHYYEFLGGLRRAVELVSGRRVEALWIDTTGARDVVRSAEESVELWARTRLLNPKWINAMLEHGYDGAREVMKRIEYLLGHAALTKAVAEWIWHEVERVYLMDANVRERIKRHNPWALHRLAGVLYEAYRRGYWKPTDEELRLLEDIITSLERELE